MSQGLQRQGGWEPLEALSGEVDSSVNRVECSVKRQDCWGDQGRDHCGSQGEGRWGLDQVVGWGRREVKRFRTA